MSLYSADDGYRHPQHGHDAPSEYHSASAGEMDHQQRRPRGLNESYYRDSVEALGLLPPPRSPRPRSLPPQSSAVVRRPRSPSRSPSASSQGRDYDGHGQSRSCAASRTPDPLERARAIVQDSFSNTPAGIGAGLLGAVVGGIVASKASEAAVEYRHRNSGRARRYSDEAAPRMVSTVLGAVAGGLGANAIANRVEGERDRHRQRTRGHDEDMDHRIRMYDGEYDGRDDHVYDDDGRSGESRRRRLRDNSVDDRYRYR